MACSDLLPTSNSPTLSPPDRGRKREREGGKREGREGERATITEVDVGRDIYGVNSSRELAPPHPSYYTIAKATYFKPTFVVMVTFCYHIAGNFGRCKLTHKWP